MNTQTYTMAPIGHVRVGDEGFYLEIDPDHVPALTGLEGFSHINILWWCHLYDEYRQISTVERPYKAGPEEMGIFATRSPVRPNPIALTSVSVLKIDYAQGIIHVPFIDAEDGSPILDIKPYHPCEDRIRDVSVPAWCAHWPKWSEDSATFDWEAEFVNAQ